MLSALIHREQMHRFLHSHVGCQITLLGKSVQENIFHVNINLTFLFVVSYQYIRAGL